MSKTAKRLLAAIVILSVLGVLALPKLIPSERGAAPRSASGAGDTLQVSARVVAPEPLENRIQTTGTIRANEAVDLVSEAAGKVTRILFREGSWAQEGDLLVKINDADLQAQQERAHHRLQLAEKREERQRQILEKGGISQEEYDLAANEVEVLRAEIRVIEAQIAKTEIRAPFSGVIGLRYVSEGSYISPQTQIATLQSLNPVKVDFSIPEKYTGLIEVGDPVYFRVAGTEQTFRGEVYAIEPKISQNTRMLQLRARSPNPGGTLTPGAFADVELVLEEIGDALMVPTIAVVPELQGKKVFVYEGGRAMPRPVETGTRTETAVQITSGLAAGDTVLTSGIQQVRPGLPVRIDVLDS